MTPRMFSSTRKCWPSDFFGATVTAIRRQLRRWRGSRCQRVERLAARLGERADRVDDVARLVRPAPNGLRGEIRTVGLDEDPIERNDGRRLPQRGRLRVRGVTCERNVVATLRGERRDLGRREAVQDDRAGKRLERSRSLLVGLTVVDHDGELELIREPELCVEQLPLLDRRRVPANRVEPGLADRDHLRMAEKLAKLVESSGFGRARLVRVDAERGEHALVRVGDGQCSPTGLDSGADRHDPRDSGLACTLDEDRGRLVARVEVRVRVGHATVAASIRASSSSTTRSGSSLAKSGFGSRRTCPAGSALGSQRPAQLS